MVNVLVWGTAEQGACAYFRGHMFDEPLKELGVNMRHISSVPFKRVRDAGPAELDTIRDLRDALERGIIEADSADFDWADVVMFRRYYDTTIKCSMPIEECSFLTEDPAEADAHIHPCRRQDDVTRSIWPTFRDTWKKGLVYETDDNHFAIKKWNGYYGAVQKELDLITDMALRADLVTVATPALGKAYAHLNPSMRVIRNAIEPWRYTPSANPPTIGDQTRPRLMYYGGTVRLRDYMGYPDDRGRWTGGYSFNAVQAIKSETQRVWVGVNPGTENIIAQVFDEQYPYVENIADFCNLIVDVKPDIGIAPLHVDDNFDICKSELHWLEYSMAGAATIAQRFMGPSPYNVIENGVDGILAKGAQEWADGVKKLVRNKDYREDMAGRAKERVIRDYDYRKRAEEWADAFHWAAEHPNYRGRMAA